MSETLDFKFSEAKSLPVILLLDTSGSMENSGNINVLNSAVLEMLRDFAEQNSGNVAIKVAIFTFGGDARQFLPLTSAKQALEEFEKQPQAYKDEVLPPEVKARVCVEAGSPYSWYKYAGDCGEIIGMTTFGASAPAHKLFEMFGFTAENVVEKAFRSINKI